MTAKEFEQQKQEIKIEVAEMIAMPFQAFPSSEELEKSLRMYQRGIIMLLNNLQPPKPQTCATCKRLTQFQHKHKDKGRCEVLVKSFLNITETNLNVSDINTFGCIYHSDYGDEK